jgi:hypothetical protein
LGLIEPLRNLRIYVTRALGQRQILKLYLAGQIDEIIADSIRLKQNPKFHFVGLLNTSTKFRGDEKTLTGEA